MVIHIMWSGYVYYELVWKKIGVVVVCMMENPDDLCALLVWVKYGSFESKISEK